MDVSIQLQKADKCCHDEFNYHELVGSLTCLATFTRLDIANSVGQLNQFLNCFDKTY